MAAPAAILKCGRGKSAYTSPTCSLAISLARNPQQLKDYIRSLSPELLDRLGGVSVDEYFISDRDGQPLVVLYGNKVGGSQRTGAIAYEQEGKDGTRLVAFQLGGVKALDQAELQELLGNPVSQR